jgi:hypothetical protein
MIYRELQAFSRSYDLAPRQPPPPLSRQKARPAKRQIIRLQVSLVLYKSSNTLWTPSSLACHARVLCSDSMIFYREAGYTIYPINQKESPEPEQKTFFLHKMYIFWHWMCHAGILR